MTTLTFTVTFLGPFAVSTGVASDGLDTTIDHDNPLPASAIKGLLKHQLEQVFGADKRLLDRIFHANNDLRWVFDDAKVDVSVGSWTRVKVDDDGRAEERQLMMGEQAFADKATFAVEWVGPGKAPADEVLALRAAARAVTSLGSHRRRGLGWVSITDDLPWTADDTELLRTWLSGTGAQPAPKPHAPAAPPFKPTDLKRYRYTFTPDKPMSAGVGDERANIRNVHRVIPGATVRGAVAAAWWQSFNDPDTFAALFDHHLQVGQLVPDDYELLSASTQVCKYQSKPGCADERNDLGLPDAALRTTCSVCGGPMTNASGWRARPGASTQVTPRTRSELADNETAKDGQLFTRSTVRSDRFTGMLQLPAQYRDWLEDATIRVGGGRSLNLGRGTITLAEEPWPDLSSGDTHLLRLVSPTIVLDEFGAADVSCDGLQRELRRVTGDAGLGVDAQPAWLRTDSISGWHVRSQLPHALDWGFAAGSVVRVTGLTQDGWAKLAGGIGVRTLEGYGQIEEVTR